MRNFFRQPSSGFTLIEVMMVIGIISALSSTLLGTVNSARNLAHDANVKRSLDGIRSYSEIHYSDNGTYQTLCNGGFPVRFVFQDLANQEGVFETNYDCVANAKEWVAIFPLKAKALYWCVDSLGNAKGVSGLLASATAGQISCQYATRIPGQDVTNDNPGGPTITLSGDNPYILESTEEDPFKEYKDPGYSAQDANGNDLTGDIVVFGPNIIAKQNYDKIDCSIITYQTEYTVVDKNKNEATTTRILIHHWCRSELDFSRLNEMVKEETPPVINLKGEDPYVIFSPKGFFADEYKEPGYDAYDQLDGDLTSEVKVGEFIEGQKHEKGGSAAKCPYIDYSLPYRVTNKRGIEGQSTRAIEVYECEK